MATATKMRVSEAEEGHQCQDNQDEARDDVVLELGDHHANVVRHIGDYRDLGTGG